MEVQQSHLGVHSSIVAVLRRHKDVSVDFLARTLGRKPGELEEFLNNLEQDGVLRREGDRVFLS